MDLKELNLNEEQTEAVGKYIEQTTAEAQENANALSGKFAEIGQNLTGIEPAEGEDTFQYVNRAFTEKLTAETSALKESYEEKIKQLSGKGSEEVVKLQESVTEWQMAHDTLKNDLTAQNKELKERLNSLQKNAELDKMILSEIGGKDVAVNGQPVKDRGYLDYVLENLKKEISGLNTTGEGDDKRYFVNNRQVTLAEFMKQKGIATLDSQPHNVGTGDKPTHANIVGEAEKYADSTGAMRYTGAWNSAKSKKMKELQG